jgi:hypothetical protein
MYVLRLLAVVLVIAIGAGILLSLVTGDRRYLAFSWKLFRYGIVFALLVFGLMILERVAVIPV